MVYADASLLEMVERLTKKTFNAMIEGVKDQTIYSRILEGKEW